MDKKNSDWRALYSKKLCSDSHVFRKTHSRVIVYVLGFVFGI